MRYMLILLLLIVALPLSAQQDNVISDTAVLSSVEAESSEEGITVTVRGDFPDSCTELGEVSQTVETEGSEINVIVTIETSRPADVMCAQVLTSFETNFVLDTSDLAPGTYTLTVNGISTEISIDPTACPEVQEQSYLYEGQGICFLFPEEYSELSAEGFVMISIPNSDRALIMVQISPEESNLEDIMAIYVEDAVPARFGAQDAFIIENERRELRQAYFVFEGNRYVFTLEGSSEEAGGGDLWETVMNSLFFYEETE